MNFSIIEFQRWARNSLAGSFDQSGKTFSRVWMLPLTTTKILRSATGAKVHPWVKCFTHQRNGIHDELENERKRSSETKARKCLAGIRRGDCWRRQSGNVATARQRKKWEFSGYWLPISGSMESNVPSWISKNATNRTAHDNVQLLQFRASHSPATKLSSKEFLSSH